MILVNDRARGGSCYFDPGAVVRKTGMIWQTNELFTVKWETDIGV
jgi:hypothetical protein